MMTNTEVPQVWSVMDLSRWLEVLTEALEDKEPAARAAAVRGMGLLGDRRDTRQILKAFRAVADMGEEETAATIRVLVTTGDTKELVQAAELDEDRVSDAAIQAIDHLKMGDALAAIVEKVAQPAEMIRHIVVASEEQSAATLQIAGDVENVARVSKDPEPLADAGGLQGDVTEPRLSAAGG